MAKSSMVGQELGNVKSRLEEVLGNANAIVKERLPEDKLEEACDKAQDVVDVLRHRTSKYSDAYKVLQGIADASSEDDGLYQKQQPSMQKLLDEAGNCHAPGKED